LGPQCGNSCTFDAGRKNPVVPSTLPCILGLDGLDTHHSICSWSGTTRPSLNIYPLPKD
jgi:hypothetical protein